MADQCLVQDCENPTRSKSADLCHKHYERKRRNGDPEVSGWSLREPVAKKRANETERTCRDCHETKPVTDYYVNKDGWRYLHCKKCHNANRMAKLRAERERNPKPKKKTGPAKIHTGPCDFNGCDRPAVSRITKGPEGGYCQTHFLQWSNTGRLFPIRGREFSYINEQERLCTACGEVKSQEEFYARTRGGKQSHCKVCMGLTNRFNLLKRAGDLEAAAAVLNAMPSQLKDKYTEALQKAIESTGGNQ